MNPEQQTLKSTLLVAAEEAIEELLEWEVNHPHSQFDEIERLVLQIRKRFGERLTVALLEAQEQCQPVPGPPCPHCKRELHYKGAKPLGFGSLVGDIALERGYYYCDHCESGLFPPR